MALSDVLISMLYTHPGGNLCIVREKLFLSAPARHPAPQGCRWYILFEGMEGKDPEGKILNGRLWALRIGNI